MSKRQKMNFSLLPDEIKIQIYFLIGLAGIIAGSRVSKEWFRLLQDAQLWKKLFERHFHQHINIKRVSSTHSINWKSEFRQIYGERYKNYSPRLRYSLSLIKDHSDNLLLQYVTYEDFRPKPRDYSSDLTDCTKSQKVRDAIFQLALRHNMGWLTKKDNYNSTIYWACACNQIERIKQFSATEAAIPCVGNITPLHIATVYGHLEAMDLLLKKRRGKCRLLPHLA